ncbi:spore coat protein [Bacillus tuaregi]|uniref:spore coat protein n=1 Tax=Bacillus tuaregi TaxID=1816695 RepID=UPI0008F83F82|nr:spore coat protein [Bacillus tuaregi]
MKESKVWAGQVPDVESVDLTKRRKNHTWNALDPSSCHPMDNGDLVNDLSGTIETIQQSFEQIVVIDSADVEVTTTDTKAAVSLQAALQATIALIISISVADSAKAEKITQDLIGKLKTTQVNRQQTYIENSRGVRIHTTDTDLVVNIQLLIQVLIALLAKIDIL